MTSQASAAHAVRAPAEPQMDSRVEAIKAAVRRSVESAERRETPYRHWLFQDLLPADVFAELKGIAFPLVDLGGVSGTREAHNPDRKYFDVDNQRAIPAVAEVSAALQDPETVGLLASHFGAPLDGTLLRIEYAQDTDGFWLKPHTDIGVKMFTLLYYLSDDPRHSDLGTDIYANAETHAGRSPFRPNAGMIFVPSDRTWHGFEKRPIAGVRKSIIINYVTQDWRAREQLSFPEEPVITG
jgi:hypothetical protein